MFDARKIQEQAIYDAVSAASDAVTAEEIIYGKNAESSSEGDAAWVKSTMQRLENRFCETDVKQIRMHCQCGYGMDEKLSLLKELMISSSNLEEFANQAKARAAGLYCMNEELYLQFHFCPCPMLAEVERLETNTWCQCTTGYSKVLFERAFDCKVDVELLKSIKMGDELCLMKIIPRDSLYTYLPADNSELHHENNRPQSTKK